MKTRYDEDTVKEQTQELLLGRNPVVEALRAGRPLQRILLAKGTHGTPVEGIRNLAGSKGVPVQEVDRVRLDEMAQGGVHQGVIAVAAAKEYATVEDILAVAKERGEAPLVMILDEVTDPHNLGSILRTAEAAGVHGVIVGKHRSVGLTFTVAKASAGAMEYIPVARVTNLAQTVDQLKEAGLWVVGAEEGEGQVYWEADLKGPLAVLVGGEGKGLGRLLRDKSDFMVRIPMSGRVGSLNVGVAAAVLIYEIRRQRGLP